MKKTYCFLTFLPSHSCETLEQQGLPKILTQR